MAPNWVIMCMGNGLLLWHFAKKNTGYAVLSALVIMTLTASGALTIARIFTYTDHPWTLGNQRDIMTAQTVKKYTELGDLLVQSTDASNPIFVFSGRRSLLAYEGWLWSNGWTGQYEQRSRDLRLLYRGGDTANTIIERYKIDGIVVGPREKNLAPNTAWLEGNLHKIQLSSDTALYLVR